MVEIKPDLDMWAYVEMFGHISFAGHVTSKPVGSFAFLQVDVADGNGGLAFTRFVGPSAIYAMTPTDEKTCQRIMADRSMNPLPYIPALPAPQRENFVGRAERADRSDFDPEEVETAP
ncbi:MAG: hypothetical protein ABSA67_10170 [Candidatus Brocadiia bacterium]|jgi:hypothetical protein